MSQLQFVEIVGGAGILLLALYSFRRPKEPEPRWGLVDVEGFRPADVLAPLLLVGLMLALGWLSAQPPAAAQGAEQSPISWVSGVAVALSALIFTALVVGLVVVYLGKFRRISVEILWGLRPHSWAKSTALGVIFIIPAACIALLLQWPWRFLLEYFGVALEEQSSITLLRQRHGPELLQILVGAVVAAPLMEECLFRGFLYPALKRARGRYFALAASSILFGLAHFNARALLPLAFLGLAFALVYERTGSLRVVVIMHSIFNLGMCLYTIYGG
jgi:hypothetical protein